VQRWETIERVDTPEGSLELRRRGARDFLITVAGRVLMTSAAHRSEDALATLACAGLGERARVLVGGLGMGYTLRAALDALAASARVTVVELNPQVVAWCRGPLAVLTDGALGDPRVTVEVGDVAPALERARGLDAVVLDLYEGPHAATQRRDDPLYGTGAIARAGRALGDGGVFAVWSEEADRGFEERLRAGGFAVEKRRAGGGRAHVVYLARKTK
jgi:spermidine synthase